MADLEWLTCDDFADTVGQTFDVRLEDGSYLHLELVQAMESSELGGPGPHGEVRHQFSLIFQGPVDRTLSQGTYGLSHAHFDEIALFLVPIGTDTHGMRYEAAFA